MPIVTAPDSGYAPTVVDLAVQGIDAENINSDVLHVTLPYGAPFATDQFVADVQAAMTAAVLAAYPGGTISRSDITYTGQVTITDTPTP